MSTCDCGVAETLLLIPGPRTAKGRLTSEMYGKPLPPGTRCWPRWKPLSVV